MHRTTALLSAACLLVVCGCAGRRPAPPPTPAAPDALAEAPVRYGAYGRIAATLLRDAHGAAPEGGEAAGGFLALVDRPATVAIVAGAFRTHFSPTEATEIADFLESPGGQQGVGAFSRWLLRGQFLRSPLPAELPAGWETFRATASGVKLFAEAFSLYRDITRAAVRAGGTLVARAITSDIGKDAALGILGALIKSGGGFF